MRNMFSQNLAVLKAVIFFLIHLEGLSLGISDYFKHIFCDYAFWMEERNRSFNLFVLVRFFVPLVIVYIKLRGLLAYTATQAAIFFHLLDETQVHLENSLLAFLS